MKYTKEELFLIWIDSFFELEYRKKAALFALYRGEKFSDFAKSPEVKREIGAEDAKFLLNFSRREYMEDVLETLDGGNVVCITRASGDYPQDLFDVPYPPLVLYAKGDINLLKGRKFSVVGSRKSIPLAIAKAEEFAAALTEAGFAVVTGLADGADAAAAKGALKSGKIISVLAGGFNHVYPACNAGLFREIVAKGLALSEYPPEIKTERYHFPVRNRIISALGEGLLVISAGKRSGTAYTAGYTEALSRQIFALPYNVNVPSGEGCNEYIRKGAVLTVRPEDILDFYNIERKETPAVSMTEEEEEIYAVIKAEGEIHIDVIAARTGKKTYELMPALGMLEIKKLIIRQAGNAYSAV
ncbi:MAG: DNA-protecting protein DprA [Bacillota bacterium]|nr:MAG: DNA-protecting protein DprA [Bacillota bacterium]